MKIVATIVDATLSIHMGEGVESESCIIDIPGDLIPSILRNHFDRLEKSNKYCEEYTKEFGIPATPSYLARLSFSLLKEETPP